MRTVWIIVSFLLIAAQALPAAEKSDSLNEEGASFAKYQSQKYLYQFLTNDYLPLLLELAGDTANTPDAGKDEADLVRFLLKMSDTQILPAEAEKRFLVDRFRLEPQSLLTLQSLAYRREKYEESLAIGDMLNKDEGALYKKGMTLLGLKWLKDAEAAFGQISSNDNLYPYARIALSQIEVRKGNLNDAEKYLRQLIGRPLTDKNNLTERVYLLLGQVLFEKKLYSDALQEFSRISGSSPLYKEALIARAWCFINLEDYANGALLLKEIKTGPSPDPAEQEALITLGYCYIKSGDAVQARKHFEELLKTFTRNERHLSRIIENRPLRKRFISILLEENTDLPNEEERYHLSNLQRDPTIDGILRAFDHLNALKAGFTEMENTITEDETYLDNIKIGLNEIVGKIEREIEGLKKTLLSSKISVQQGSARASSTGTDYADYYSNYIFEEWKRSPDRKFVDETRVLIKLILQDWLRDDFSRCYGNPIICYVASFIKPEKGTFSLHQVRSLSSILDSIARDLKSTKVKNKVIFEELLDAERKKIEERIRTDRETIDKLEALRKEIRKNINSIGKDMDANRNILESHILLHFIKARYELGSLKARIAEDINRIKPLPDNEVQNKNQVKAQ